MIPTLEIDGIAVATVAMLEFDQGYDDVLPVTLRRTLDNSGKIRSNGTPKLVTTISAKGWMPAGFAGIDRAGAHVIRCAMPHDVASAAAAITIPAARRSQPGYEPYAFAVVGGELVETTISDITDNVATCAAVPGADSYRVFYYPEITAFISRLDRKGFSSENYTWQIEAEEL